MRIALALLLACAALASEPTGVDIRIADDRTTRVRREIHDLAEVRIRLLKGEFIVDLTMARPFEQAIFLDAHIDIDADDKSDTGLDGFDFGVHAFAGSRYRRNTAPDARGAPLSRRGTVLKVAHQKKSGRGSWLNSAPKFLAPPKVKGKTMQFRFPMDLLRLHGYRYNKQIRWRVYTESTISEHPLLAEYVCGEDGMDIKIDGKEGDWPAIGVQTSDKNGDLHPDASEVDITGLQVEHDAKSVYALVRLARGGFGSHEPGDDVIDRDKIVVCLEPVGARAYMKYVEAMAYTSMGELEGREYSYRTGDRFIEFGIPRKAEQGKFRVLAYADAERVDYLPNGGARKLVIPTKAWGAK
ncbi:MAG: hypothetical protein ACYTGZ_19500 [Planctomycetota bacterium]|jgi:hypothetical protein